MTENDTVAAVATAPGEGGIAVVRVSGADVKKILGGMFRRASGGDIAPGRLHYGRAVDRAGNAIDEVMAVYLPAPHTYTREDVCEIHCHGGRVMPLLILRRAIELGARPAQPGEFTRRAFLNGRIDLSEAEAVMQIVSAGGEAAARQAARQLRGGASRAVKGYIEKIESMLSGVAAAVDFPEEIDGEQTRGELLAQLDEIIENLTRDADPERARVVRNGLTACLIGPPNTGKSSLLNALCGGDRAIVTDIAGTTRDVLTEEISLGGARVLLSDTAGLRESGDAIERIGVARAGAAQREADVVLVVLDYHRAVPGEEKLLDAEDPRRYLVYNKRDLPPRDHYPAFPEARALTVSAKTGEGIGSIEKLLSEKASAGENQPLTLERHLYLAKEAVEALKIARESLYEGQPVDLCAVDAQRALAFLCEITGENAAERVIDGVFQNFCVGK